MELSTLISNAEPILEKVCWEADLNGWIQSNSCEGFIFNMCFQFSEARNMKSNQRFGKLNHPHYSSTSFPSWYQIRNQIMYVLLEKILKNSYIRAKPLGV